MEADARAGRHAPGSGAEPLSPAELAQEQRRRGSILSGVLLAHVTPRRVRAGDVIVREGDKGDDMFFLVVGEVEVSAASSGSDAEDAGGLRFSKRLTSASPNIDQYGMKHTVFFGERALLAPDGRRTASVTAVTDCSLLRLSRSGFRTVLLHDGAFAEDIAERFYTTEEDRAQLRRIADAHSSTSDASH